MKSRILWVFLIVTGLVQAHFVFVTPEAEGTTARVFISENLSPDLDANFIASTKLSLRMAEGKETSLTLVRADPKFFSTQVLLHHIGRVRNALCVRHDRPWRHDTRWQISLADLLPEGDRQ
jgi:hypothetical protein